MAVREGRKPGQWVVEFTQRGERVFRRLPQGITKAQAREYETKIRRELFDGTLGHKDELTLPGAIGLWLQSNRRKNQRQAVSEARQWEPFVSGRLLREAPEVAQEAVAVWTAQTASARTGRYASRGGLDGARSGRESTTRSPKNSGDVQSQNTRQSWPALARPHEWPRGSSGSRLKNGSAPFGTARTHSGARNSAAASTINRRLALLKAVCKHAYKQGYPENLSGRITLLKEDNKREVYLTRGEVARLAKFSPSTATRAAIWLAAYSGLRASELIALTGWDSRAGTLAVATSKTGRPRLVPLPLSARRWAQYLPLGLSYWQLRKEFISARIKAGLPEVVTLHTLRHTCASWLIQAGVDLFTVGKILGHSGPQTTSRYAHLSTQTLERAMARLK